MASPHLPPIQRPTEDGTRLSRALFLRLTAVFVICIATVIILPLIVDSEFIFSALVSFGLDEGDALLLLSYIRPLRWLLLLILAVIAFCCGYCALLKPFIARITNEIANGILSISGNTTVPSELAQDMPDTYLLLNHVHAQIERQQFETLRNEQQKNDLVMYLAHDIRTPLTSVIGYLSLLDEVPDMTAAQRKNYTQIALRKAKRLDTLTDEFFEITRFNLRAIELDKRRIDLRVLVDQVVEEMYPQLEAHGNTVHCNLPPRFPVDADPQKLARVLNNLLRNAVSYSDADSPIDISGLEDQNTGKVTLRVTSQGASLNQEQLERIFERFYRLDSSRNSDTGGSGLGLAISKSIVEAHGGSITATSAHGSTSFTICLPSALTDIH